MFGRDISMHTYIYTHIHVYIYTYIQLFLKNGMSAEEIYENRWFSKVSEGLEGVWTLGEGLEVGLSPSFIYFVSAL